MTAAVIATFLVRCLMVLLFLPFSALDKVLGFNHAVKQTQQMFPQQWLARAVILGGLVIEVVCSLCVVTGVADRAGAFTIAGYCVATAVLFKQFWKPGDFWSDPDGRGRGLFWDFLKNMALGAGFLLLVIGTDGSGLQLFLNAPFKSSHPYWNH